MSKKKLFFLPLMLFAVVVQSQTVLTLEECIQEAQKLSPSFVLAETRVETSYWGYRNYRAGFLPQIRLNATLPNYSGGIERITQQDGSEDFRNRSLAYEYIRLSVDQNIALTGGLLSFSSDLQRIDNFEPNTNTQYVSVPFQFSYTQPVLLYNAFKWDKKIEPLRYKESQRKYIEDLELIGEETVNYYFEAMNAQISHQIALLNRANQDTLFKISKGRYELGKIAENDLLQIELSYLNAENEVKQTELSLEIATQGLKRYLSIPTTESISLILPNAIPEFEVPFEQARIQARANQQQVLSFRRRRLEAEQNVARAKGNGSYQLSINAGIGRSEQGGTFSEVYPGSQQQQYISVGIGIPLVDWGKNKAAIRQAKANQELVDVSVQQDEIEFEQEVYLQVMRFNMQKERLAIAAKADTIAQRRFEVTKNRYYIGKISITDLNIAQNEKDLARMAYLSELRNFWAGYFVIRRLTHWDFEQNKLIEYEEADF